MPLRGVSHPSPALAVLNICRQGQGQVILRVRDSREPIRSIATPKSSQQPLYFHAPSSVGALGVMYRVRQGEGLEGDGVWTKGVEQE